MHREVEEEEKCLRTGLGYDVHALVEGRPLILGGVELPYEKGLAGHSDADVLTHAAMDALLGACALGDIGRLFPDTDPAYEGVNSMLLLQQVGQLVEAAGYRVANLDVVLMAEAPKIAPFVEFMRAQLAWNLNVRVGRISIKATTTEGLGFIGRGEGMAAQAIATVLPIEAAGEAVKGEE
jgi:2-C-methyl-D-erythritol 2,4-cyclodiphosphate synthase